MLAFLLSFVITLSPVIATLAASELCLHQLIAPPKTTQISYAYETCSQIDNPYGECDSIDSIEKIIPFTPPFVYSNQCRNAVLHTFVPYFIQSCVLDLFFTILLIVFFDNRVKDISFHLEMNQWLYKVSKWDFIRSCLGLPYNEYLHYNVKDILLPDMTISIVEASAQFVLLLFYGFTNCFLAIAIGKSRCIRFFLDHLSCINRSFSIL